MKEGKKLVLLTGATGTMGHEGLKRMMPLTDHIKIRVIARDSKKNRKLLKSYQEKGVEVVWGDLCDYEAVKRSVESTDLILHVGGLVSPRADKVPELTLKTNVTAAENIVKAVKELHQEGMSRIVYIGSVAEYGHRDAPNHWGRTGDPLKISHFDAYALSKVIAERVIVESGVKHWAVLRQTGILYPALLLNGSDPISFHVPLKGVLEWATVEDSGQLLANLCGDVPEEFWNEFYNISSGEDFRLTNYEFEKLLMGAIGCPPPEKAFRANWFATRNFHGMWYTDADRLENLLHFRENISAEAYFRRLASQLPFYFSMARIVPAWLIRFVMKQVAKKPGLGTLNWLSTNNKDRICAYFGSREEWEAIPDWDGWDLSRPSEDPVICDHGYDESLPDSALGIEEMRAVAKHNDGECLSQEMAQGDLSTSLQWRCNKCGTEFVASPVLVLKGGHFCPSCLKKRLSLS
jgi:nucleoside-diphosphate-sugar epimerase